MAALDSLGDESPNIMEAKDIVEDDEARANRDRYHWSEVDLGSPGGWLKEWISPTGNFHLEAQPTENLPRNLTVTARHNIQLTDARTDERAQSEGP